MSICSDGVERTFVGDYAVEQWGGRWYPCRYNDDCTYDYFSITRAFPAQSGQLLDFKHKKQALHFAIKQQNKEYRRRNSNPVRLSLSDLRTGLAA